MTLVNSGGSTTSTVKFVTALAGGTPSSVTRTPMLCEPASLFVAVHENNPAVEMPAATGAPGSRVKVNMFVGTSMSVANAVKLTVSPTYTARFEMAASIGAVFTSFTITVNVCVAESDGEPLSITRKEIVFVPGPCASVGVHVMTPVLVLMIIPTGDCSSANVSVFVGKSVSDAEFVIINVVSSLIW